MHCLKYEPPEQCHDNLKNLECLVFFNDSSECLHALHHSCINKIINIQNSSGSLKEENKNIEFVKDHIIKFMRESQHNNEAKIASMSDLISFEHKGAIINEDSFRLHSMYRFYFFFFFFVILDHFPGISLFEFYFIKLYICS